MEETLTVTHHFRNQQLHLKGPSTSCTHPPIIFLSLDRGTSSHVPFFSIFLYSSAIALIHVFSLYALVKLFHLMVDSKAKKIVWGVFLN